MHMKVSFVASFIFALPVIFYQIWKFVSPDFYQRKKKYLIPFIIMSTTLFLAGSVFCFVIILPFAMTFLLDIKPGL